MTAIAFREDQVATAAVSSADLVRIKRLMQTRIEPPRSVESSVPIAKPWHWHVFWYVRAFLLHATLRSVVGAVVKYSLRLPLAWLWEHGYLLVTTVLSRNVSEEVYHARMTICVECSQGVPRAGYLYCRACGCPSWRGARLGYKNRKAGHNCPLGLHPGSVSMRRQIE